VVQVNSQLNMPNDLLSKSKDLAKCFKALSDGVRLRIVAQLAASAEPNVSELVEALEVSQPLISWHLRRLEKVGLSQGQEEGPPGILFVESRKAPPVPAGIRRGAWRGRSTDGKRISKGD